MATGVEKHRFRNSDWLYELGLCIVFSYFLEKWSYYLTFWHHDIVVGINKTTINTSQHGFSSKITIPSVCQCPITLDTVVLAIESSKGRGIKTGRVEGDWNCKVVIFSSHSRKDTHTNSKRLWKHAEDSYKPKPDKGRGTRKIVNIWDILEEIINLL